MARPLEIITNGKEHEGIIEDITRAHGNKKDDQRRMVIDYGRRRDITDNEQTITTPARLRHHVNIALRMKPAVYATITCHPNQEAAEQYVAELQYVRGNNQEGENNT